MKLSFIPGLIGLISVSLLFITVPLFTPLEPSPVAAEPVAIAAAPISTPKGSWKCVNSATSLDSACQWKASSTDAEDECIPNGSVDQCGQWACSGTGGNARCKLNTAKKGEDARCHPEEKETDSINSDSCRGDCPGVNPPTVGGSYLDLCGCGEDGKFGGSCYGKKKGDECREGGVKGKCVVFDETSESSPGNAACGDVNVWGSPRNCGYGCRCAFGVRRSDASQAEYKMEAPVDSNGFVSIP
jgi:hypothetical protein